MRDRRQRAQSAIEFALTLPVLLMLLTGTIEFGRLFWAYGVLLHAAQDGARHGAVLGYARDDAAIRSHVQQVAARGRVSIATTDVTVASTCSYTSSTAVAAASRTRGNVLTVRVQYRHQLLIAFFPQNMLSLALSSTMEIEQGAPSTCT